MSQTLKNSQRLLKIVESFFRRTTYCWSESLVLTDVNNAFMADLYTVMANMWYDVSFQPELLNLRWAHALCEWPVSKVVDLLKQVDFALISEENTSYASFNRWLRSSLDKGAMEILSPLTGCFMEFFDSTKRVKELRSCLRFITRANLPEPIGLEEEAFREWHELAHVPWIPVDTTPEAKELQNIYPRRRSVAQVCRLHGRFGPGAYAFGQQKSLLAKYKAFWHDREIEYAMKLADTPFPLGRMPQDKLVHSSWLRTTELQFVPKQLNKLRTVCKESPGLMFFQLGLMDEMLRVIRNSPWRNHIDLKHPELNQELAMAGGLSGEYATIDLSSASDNIRLDLVKNLFKGTALRELLLAFRSRQVAYFKECEIFTPTTFAPMGSGICFPTMCCVIGSVVSSVMRRHRDKRAWHVYGDDVVLPSNRFSEVVDRLTLLGLVINKEKSFYDPRKGFRESCGADFFYGFEAHPLFVSRQWTGLVTKEKHDRHRLESNVALANSLRPYRLARLRVVQGLHDYCHGFLFDDRGEVGIFSKDPSNYHLRRRWNPELQRDEFRCYGLRVKSPTPTAEEYEAIRLFEWFRAVEWQSPEREATTALIARPSPPRYTWDWRSPAPG